MPDDEQPSDKQPPNTDAPPPVQGTNVAPEDIPRDSLGRSMANKRGRKPGPQAPRASGTPAQANQLKKELSKRLPSDPKELTDEAVGQAFAGAFAACGLVSGATHWRLFADERQGYGEVFGPLARLYGKESLVKWITALTAIPLLASTIGPRVAIQGMIQKGEVKKTEARVMLLNVRAMMAAEEQLDINKMAREQEAQTVATANAGKALQGMVQNGFNAAAALSAEEMQTEGVVNAQEPAPQGKPS